MMSSIVNIVEIINGKYEVNKEVLHTVILSAKDCDSIALISMIGRKCSGKSFLINCLLNYLESNERNIWPQSTSIDYNYGFTSNFNNKIPVIQLCSKPFKLEHENRKIAIFLMDSSHVFTDILEISKTKLMEDIIGLFMLTSSTVIFNQKFNFASQDLEKFQECLSKNLDFIKPVNSFQELFFYIEDWDSKFAEKDHLFGLKGGKDYINNESEGLEFQNFFSNIECYLMPPPGMQINKLDLDFSLLNDQYIIELSQIVKMKLLNIDEMQIKTNPETDEPIKANELIELFESYINRLNAQLNNDMENTMSNRSICTTSTCILYKQKYMTEKSLEERQTSLNQVPQVVNYFKSEQTVFGDNKTQHKSCDTYSFGVQSNTSLNRNDSQTNFKENDGMEVISNQTEIDMRNETQKDVEMIDLSSDTSDFVTLDSVNSESDSIGVNTHLNTTESTSFKNKDELIFENITKAEEITEDKIFNCCECESNEVRMDTEMPDVNSGTIDSEVVYSAMSETDSIRDVTHCNEENSTSLNENEVQMISENMTEAKEITEVRVINYYQNLLIDFNNGLEKASKDTNFDFESGLSKAHNDEKSKSMSSFKNEFEGHIHSELYEKYRKKLYNEIDVIKDQKKLSIAQQMNELSKQYVLKMNVSINLYDKEMKASIERHLNSNTLNFKLANIHVHCKQISVQSFESEVKENNDFNINLLKKFKNKLKDELEVRKKKYEMAFNLIKNYRNDWDQNDNKYRYIPLNHLQEIKKNLCRKVSLALDELNDQELKQIIDNSLENIFVLIKQRNEDINNQEIVLTKEVVNFVFNLFCKRLNYKLKSGLFTSNVVKQMHQKLLEYTIQTMITDCNFKEYQKHLNEKCENDLRNRVQQNYTNMSSEYLETSLNAKSVLKKARDQAINKYYSEMEKTLSEKPFYKRNEFETISYRLSNDSIKMNEQLVESLKYYFNPDFYRFLVSQNNININEKIAIHKDKFAKQNENKSPKTSSIAIYFGQQYLSAANYEKDVRFISDKNGKKLRPNSIAFSDQFLFGSDAKAHYEKFQLNTNLFDKNFDIKQLIAKYKQIIPKEKLDSYPFEIIGEEMRVKVDNPIKHDFPIESLIALQVLDIKLDAEKQLGNSVMNAVLTVPTHYNLRQRNAFRDVAKIAGLEEVIVLSEISAAAISYATHINRANNHSMSTVFFVVINEFECDAAVCSIKDREIEYKSYFHQNLICDVENTSLMKSFSPFSLSSFINLLRNVKEKSVKEKFFKALKTLFEITIHSASTKPKYIDNIVIGGDSNVMDFVKECAADYFVSNSFYSCDPIDIIINGSAVLSQTIAGNEFKRLYLKEVSFYPYYYSISGRYTQEKKSLLLEKNNLLCTTTKPHYVPQSYDFPLKISIFQDKTLVSLYKIANSLSQDFLNQWNSHKINFKFDEFGEIKLTSKLMTKNNMYELNLIEIKLGLTEEEIIKEHNIIASIELQIKDKQKLNEENSAIIQAKNDLEKFYLEVKKSVDSNSSLRGLKLKKINKEMEITLKLLQSSDSDVKSFSHQKLKLQQIFAIL